MTIMNDTFNWGSDSDFTESTDEQIERLKRHGTKMVSMVFPKESDSPEVKKLLRLAGTAGRSFYNEPKYKKHTQKLYDFMQTVDTGRLRYWAGVVMLRNPTAEAGATGTGAFWAVASRIVNEIAVEILQERAKEFRAKYGDSMFVVE